MEKEFFLHDVMVESGTGNQISGAVIQVLIEWAILLRIIAMAFDTCSVNTGVETGKFWKFGTNKFRLHFEFK